MKKAFHETLKTSPFLDNILFWAARCKGKGYDTKYISAMVAAIEDHRAMLKHPDLFHIMHHPGLRVEPSRDE